MRKRIGALILAGAIVACSTVGWAEEIDFSSYTLDQLIEFRKEINELINEELSETDNIGTGYYVAGVDIQTGSYEIAPARDESIDVLICTTLDSYNDYANRNPANTLTFTLDYDEESADSSTISLKDGNVLQIRGDATIKAIKPSWAM